MSAITADSIPIYEQGWFQLGQQWSCTQWIEWHVALVKKYGLEEANRRFNEYWNKQGNLDTQAMWCQYDRQWVAYWKSQGEYVSNDPFASIWTSGVGAVDNLATGVEGVTAGLSRGVNVLGKIIPITTILIVTMLVIGLGILIFTVARNPSVLMGPARMLSLKAKSVT